MNIGKPSVIQTKLGPVEFLEEGSGPAILCIHGAMGGYDQSITLGRTIGEQRFRTIAVSRPGFLGTPLKAGRTAPEQADLHAALLDALNIPKVIVMAVSGGGPSAMHFALRHKERCSKLVLCSTVGSPAEQNIPLSFHLTNLLARITPFIRNLRKKVESNLAGAMARSISDPVLLEKTLKDPEVMDLFKVVLLGTFDRMAERIPGTRTDIAIASRFACELEQISAQTLVVHGDKDPMVPFAKHGKVLADRIPNARLCLATGGEHVTIFTHRRQVQDAVREFLRDM